MIFVGIHLINPIHSRLKTHVSKPELIKIMNWRGYTEIEMREMCNCRCLVAD